MERLLTTVCLSLAIGCGVDPGGPDDVANDAVGDSSGDTARRGAARRGATDTSSVFHDLARCEADQICRPDLFPLAYPGGLEDCEETRRLGHESMKEWCPESFSAEAEGDRCFHESEGTCENLGDCGELETDLLIAADCPD